MKYTSIEDAGAYVQYNSEDYYVTKGYGNIYSPGEMKKVTSYTQGQGDYIDSVSSADPAAIPDNGPQDGFWYVKI
ncbi:MAG: hypothetical protein IJY66_03680 [Clostridia bacterium]|nr:hypothetical protein [Clostridia bacterium]